MQGSVRDSQTGAVGQNHSQLIKCVPELGLCTSPRPQPVSFARDSTGLCSFACLFNIDLYLFTKLFRFKHAHCTHLKHCTAVVFGEWHEHSRFHLLMFQLARQVQLELKAGRRQSCFPYSLVLSLPLMQPDRELSQLKT